MLRTNSREVEHFMQSSDSEEFLYLTRVDAVPGIYDPYNLRVVPYVEIDRDDFFTLTSK